MMAEKKTFEHECFDATLSFAESLGWVDTYGDSDDGDWDSGMADCCEQEAIDFIKSKGYAVTTDGEER